MKFPKNLRRIIALIILVSFIPQQVSYAGRLDDAYSNIKSTLKSSIGSAKTSYNSVNQSIRSSYTAASNVFTAAKSRAYDLGASTKSLLFNANDPRTNFMNHPLDAISQKLNLNSLEYKQERNVPSREFLGITIKPIWEEEGFGPVMMATPIGIETAGGYLGTKLLSKAPALIKYESIAVKEGAARYVPKISQYVSTGVKNLMSNPTARVELGRAGEMVSSIGSKLYRGLTLPENLVTPYISSSAGRWLAAQSIRVVQYEAGLYGFRQSGLENTLVPTAYRPAADTTLDYVLPFFISPGRGGAAKETTKAFFSPGGIKTFAQTGIEHLGNLKNKVTFSALKSAVETLPAKLTRESIKSGVANAGKAWAKEAKLGYANLASEGKIWVPVQMLRQGVHVAQDLAVFQAGSAVFLGALNKGQVFFLL